MENKLTYLLQSRKFWAVVLAIALILGRAYAPNFPLTNEQVSYLIYVLIAYILGTAIEDNGRITGSKPSQLSTSPMEISTSSVDKSTNG